MSRQAAFLILAALIIAILAGWYSVPHYRAPADDGEDRLRERAAAYYAAMRRIDYRAVAQLFTPARQLKQVEELEKTIAEHDATAASVPDDQRNDMQRSANAVRPQDVVVELDGEWAVTSGTATIFLDEASIPGEFDKAVWVRTGGDWWIYEMKIPELIAYGNPPDYPRQVLRDRLGRGGQKLGTMEFTPEPSAGAETGETTPEEEPEPADAETGTEDEPAREAEPADE